MLLDNKSLLCPTTWQLERALLCGMKKAIFKQLHLFDSIYVKFLKWQRIVMQNRSVVAWGSNWGECVTIKREYTGVFSWWSCLCRWLDKSVHEIQFHRPIHDKQTNKGVCKNWGSLLIGSYPCLALVLIMSNSMSSGSWWGYKATLWFLQLLMDLKFFQNGTVDNY